MVVAIFIGLVIAFAIQFLLANLGLLLGISLLKYRIQASEPSHSNQSHKSSEERAKVTFLTGSGVLVTLNLILFIACFLAVRFSTAQDPFSGATLGIVIWFFYFLILIWMSYSAVNSVFSWLFGSVVTTLGQLIETISDWIQNKQESASTPLSEEGLTQLIHQEIKTAVNEFDLQQVVEDYFNILPPQKLDLDPIRERFSDLLKNLDLKFLKESHLSEKIDEQTFISLINERTNLATAEAKQIVKQLESLWQQAVTNYQDRDLNDELLNFLQSANPEKLQFEQLIERLEKLVAKQSEDGTATDLDLATWWQQIDWRAIKSVLLNRIDLSEVELEDIWDILQSVYQKISSDQLPKLSFINTIRNDVEDYLWHSPSWYLSCNKGWQEFKQIIYDPQAAPKQVRAQLEEIEPEYFSKILQQREDLNSEKIKVIREHLELVRQEVFNLLEQAELREQIKELSEGLKTYLQNLEVAQLQDDSLQPKIEQLIIESGINTKELRQFLLSWQELDWERWLEQRQDLEPKQLKQILNQLEQIGHGLREKVENWQLEIKSTIKELHNKLESYLRYTNLQHLTSEKIEAKLEQLSDEAFNRLPKRQEQLPAIETSALLKILEKRKGLNQEQAKKIICHIEAHWQKFEDSSASEKIQIEALSQELLENLVDYLSQVIEKNLNLSDIEEDLPQLFNLAKTETTSLIEQQLLQLNWHDISHKLQEAHKYSVKQIKRAIKLLRQGIYKLIKLPRRWAVRTSVQVQDVVDELNDFLSYSNKSEFSSEHLEAHLKSIFEHSKTSPYWLPNSRIKNLKSLVSISPDTVSNFLSSRPDLTPVEVEQINDRLMAVVNRLFAQMKTAQEKTNQQVQNLLEQIGNYFSSLNLSNLGYENIKASLAKFDFSSLTQLWKEKVEEIPLEKLGSHLGKLTYEALLKIIHGSELFSESIMEEIQGLQDYIAEQVETIKVEAGKNAEEFKEETLQQLQNTIPAIASAIYWIFALSFTCAVTSATAGFLATKV
jgi:hypothetical protein